jgi:hypothetical protein
MPLYKNWEAKIVFPAPGPPITNITLFCGKPPLINSFKPSIPVGTVFKESDTSCTFEHAKRLYSLFIIFVGEKTLEDRG